MCYKNIAAKFSADYQVDATSVAAALWLMMLLLVIEFFQAVCDFLNFFFLFESKVRAGICVVAVMHKWEEEK